MSAIVWVCDLRSARRAARAAEWAGSGSIEEASESTALASCFRVTMPVRLVSVRLVRGSRSIAMQSSSPASSCWAAKGFFYKLAAAVGKRQQMPGKIAAIDR